METKKELKKELAECKTDLIYYKSKLSIIESRLRSQKETNGSLEDLVKELNDIIYKGVFYVKSSEYNKHGDK